MKLKGLFLNTSNAKCSIYESGRMVYNCLKLSDHYSIDYQEVDQYSRSVSSEYNFYIFNYHIITMQWLDTKSVKKLPGLKATLVLEVAKNNPFIYCPKEDFDIYIVLDPTLNSIYPNVYSFPRPIEPFIPGVNIDTNSIPIIGTFGFATEGKGFDKVIEAVNKEFNHAIIKINIPEGTYVSKDNFDKLISKLKNYPTKDGVQVYITNDYMEKQNLINWCTQNTLNVFLYDRNMPGLAATTDQAISSGRPLAVSDNDTFRHIHQFIKPYPYRSLYDSIKYSQKEVYKIKELWSDVVFKTEFEKILNKFTFEYKSYNIKKRIKLRSIYDIKTKRLMKLLKIKNIFTNKLIIPLVNIITRSNNNNTKFLLEISENKTFKENTILFISHNAIKCGIHEFGWNIKEALKKSSKYYFCYAECSNSDDLYNAIIKTSPSLIIYNYYHLTMPWFTKEVKSKYIVPQIGYMHEFDQTNILEKVTKGFFDYYIFPDPSLDLTGLNNCFKTGRLLINYNNHFSVPFIPTIGSFGFGFDDKGFERLIMKVQDDFDEAIVKINMPFSHFIDPDGTKMTLPLKKRCKELIKKPNIKLDISHEYFSQKQILDFLASNTINAFYYDSNKNQGISSVLDYALSVQRPIAISFAGMFRHMGSIIDDISIEKNSFQSIIEKGISPLMPFFNEWSESSFLITYNNIIDSILKKDSKLEKEHCFIDDNFLNIILDNSYRIKYKEIINKMFELAPQMMSRKILEANIQQAFVLNTVLGFLNKTPNSKVLCVGSFDDTACECLKKMGQQIEEIDPVFNFSLNDFLHQKNTLKGSYDIIFSTSVLEHIRNDELFIKQISVLLKKGGKAILTCDYKPGYKKGDPHPEGNFRFYTIYDLEQRLIRNAMNCKILGETKWDKGEIDFFYNGILNYAFATLVFQKI